MKKILLSAGLIAGVSVSSMAQAAGAPPISAQKLEVVLNSQNGGADCQNLQWQKFPLNQAGRMTAWTPENTSGQYVGTKVGIIGTPNNSQLPQFAGNTANEYSASWFSGNMSGVISQQSLSVARVAMILHKSGAQLLVKFNNSSDEYAWFLEIPAGSPCTFKR